MNFSKLFESKQGDVGAELKIALVCIVCAVLPYYTTILTDDYPQRRLVGDYYYFYEVMVRQSIGEEALYRLIPLAVTIHFFGVRWWQLSIVILGTSIYFSLLHNGYISILALGAGSILLAIAFLYYGGLQKNYLRGFMWCSGIHIAINLVINVVFPFLV